MNSTVKRVFFTVREMSEITGLRKSDIRIICRAPYCEALSLRDDGNILLTENAIDNYFARHEQDHDSEFAVDDPDWDWKLPRQKYVAIPEIIVYFGISKPTAYALTKFAGFPTVVIENHIYIPTLKLKEWLDGRAKKFHNINK